MPIRRVALIFILLLTTCLLFSQSQSNIPITYKGLCDALRIGGLSMSELTDIVKQRGVDFELTRENVDELRHLGADDDLLVAIRLNKRSGGGGSAAPATGWQTFSYPTEGFRIATPSKPQFQSSPVEGGYTLHAYLTSVPPSGALLVGVVDYGSKRIEGDVYTRLEAGMKGSLEYWHARLIREKRITINGYPGLEFEGEATESHWFGRYYLVDSVLYEVLAGYPPGTTYADLYRFVDSFQLIPRQ